MNVHVVAAPFGNRLLTGQFVMALFVSVTVPAASVLFPLTRDALMRAEVTPVTVRDKATADAARPSQASRAGRLGNLALWRVRSIFLSSLGPVPRPARREGKAASLLAGPG